MNNVLKLVVVMHCAFASLMHMQTTIANDTTTNVHIVEDMTLEQLKDAIKQFKLELQQTEQNNKELINQNIILKAQAKAFAEQLSNHAANNQSSSTPDTNTTP